MKDQTPIQTDCPVEQAFTRAMTGGSELVTAAIAIVRVDFPEPVEAKNYDQVDAKAAALRRTARHLAKS